MLGLIDALSCLSREICSKEVGSSGGSIRGTVAALNGKPRPHARVIGLGLVVAE